MVNAQSIEPYLVEHPLFKWLDYRYVRIMADCASHESFKPEDMIFRQGEEAHRFFIIIHGRVSVETIRAPEGTIRIQMLGDGDILGWSWLFAPYQWQFDARAVDHTGAVALDARVIRAKCEEDHNLGYELMKRFSSVMLNRLQATRMQLLSSGASVRELREGQIGNL